MFYTFFSPSSVPFLLISNPNRSAFRLNTLKMGIKRIVNRNAKIEKSERIANENSLEVSTSRKVYTANPLGSSIEGTIIYRTFIIFFQVFFKMKNFD